MNIAIKLTLTILLFGCLIDFSYGYYEFVRYASMTSFLFFAYSAHQNNCKNEAFIYLVLAILFQPFFKIALGRILWNIVDVLLGIGLITSLFLPKKEQ